jgi:hypothetical protein
MLLQTSITILEFSENDHGLPRKVGQLTISSARHVITIPPGFHKITVDRRTAVCEPADDQWVKAALSATPAATRPSTNPSDIVDHLHANRAVLKARIAGDLSLKNLASVDELIDNTLLPQARKLAELDVPIYYFVTTAARLKELLKGGWSDPRFTYNRATDEVGFDPDLRMSDEREMDEMLMPVVYAPDAAPADRQKQMATVITNNESSIGEAFSRRAQIITQLSIIEFIQKQVFDPMNLKDDQRWLAYGIEAVLSAHYMHDTVGLSYDELLARMTMDNPRNPIRAMTVDLLHPNDPKAMKPQWVPLYNDAYRIRSARVVQDWLKKTGNSSISLTLAAMRASPPADGPALVKLIAVTTGVDLTNELKSKL